MKMMRMMRILKNLMIKIIQSLKLCLILQIHYYGLKEYLHLIDHRKKQRSLVCLGDNPLILCHISIIIILRLVLSLISISIHYI